MKNIFTIITIIITIAAAACSTTTHTDKTPAGDIICAQVACSEPTTTLYTTYADLFYAAAETMQITDAGSPPPVYTTTDAINGRHNVVGVVQKAFGTQAIVVRADLSDTVMKITLIHEILHSLQEGEGHPADLFGEDYVGTTAENTVMGDHVLARMTREHVTDSYTAVLKALADLTPEAD